MNGFLSSMACPPEAINLVIFSLNQLHALRDIPAQASSSPSDLTYRSINLSSSGAALSSAGMDGSISFSGQHRSIISRRGITISAVRSAGIALQPLGIFTVSSLFGLCSHKVDGVVRVWQCSQTASLPRMIGGVA